jgi:hypothetical protein
VLLEAVGAVAAEAGGAPESTGGPARALREEELHLVCWEYVWS